MPDLPKVLLVVIDAASPRVMCPAVQTGRLANLKRVADAGSLHQGSVTIFPSITPAATASIITGCYPSEHGIAGASWYDEGRDEVAYYGDDFWVIAREGFGSFLHDFLVRLNGDRLKAPTLFEMVERTGRKAACVNYLVYRGLVRHTVHVPTLMTLLPGVPAIEDLHGPSMLCLGDFVTPTTGRGRKVRDRGGVLHRFGMDDASTAAMLRQLVEDRALPEFTVAYFADNDYRSHEVGPYQALPVIDAVDRALGDLFDAAGGAERFLDETYVIVTSDHGHCDILADQAAATVPLHEVLGQFRHAELGRPWRERDEIMICPNMRAAQIYVRRPSPATVEQLIRAALAEERVDQVLWDAGLTGSPGAYGVASRRGRLEFWRGNAGDLHADDDFGTAWSWRGELSALRMEVIDSRLASSEYPNALERIANLLDAPNSGQLWLTARPGCEFETAGGTPHVGGGSHGALHALDSLSPVVIGGPGAPELPRTMRSIDIAPLCAGLLGLSMRYKVSDPRAAVSRG